jgi:hypothetical protein
MVENVNLVKRLSRPKRPSCSLVPSGIYEKVFGLQAAC